MIGAVRAEIQPGGSHETFIHGSAGLDCDGGDAALFKSDFGRSMFKNPCTNPEPCNGDFDCDVDVDGTDASIFKDDFGRSSFKNPCPNCEGVEGCTY